MLIIEPGHSDRFKALKAEHGQPLQDKLDYLAQYGSSRIDVRLLPDANEPYFSVLWTQDGEPWMNGGLVRHDDGVWGVHT
jgi:hypothetical protein